MKQNPALTWLVSLIAVLAIVTAGMGLFSQGGDGPFPFATIHGNTMEMYGRGIFRNDSLFTGGLLRGTDVVTFFVSVPLLLIGLSHRRGSLRGVSS